MSDASVSSGVPTVSLPPQAVPGARAGPRDSRPRPAPPGLARRNRAAVPRPSRSGPPAPAERP